MKASRQYALAGRALLDEVVAVQLATLTDMIMDGMTIRPAGSRAGAIVRT